MFLLFTFAAVSSKERQLFPLVSFFSLCCAPHHLCVSGKRRTTSEAMPWLPAFLSLVLLLPCFNNQQSTAGQSTATGERSVSQVLNPPSFNLAEGRKITASATCGEGVDEPEMYCKLVGANWADSPNKHIYQGQACDFCDPNNASLSHKAEYAIDGTERWWQSPPLSRGVKYNEVNVTIDLGQVCRPFLFSLFPSHDWPF